MFRTTIGLSFILALGGLAACSSKPTNGNGMILGGGTSGTSTGGTGSSTGGTGTSTGGTGTSTGGTGTSTSGTGGSPTACADTNVTCVDATQATDCNTDTGLVETITCADYFAEIGVISNGCQTDATSAGCTIDGFLDEPCRAGTSAIAMCEQLTSSETLQFYIACFQQVKDAHTVIPCFANYTDCASATANCIPDEAGTGEGGAGP